MENRFRWWRRSTLVAAAAAVALSLAPGLWSVARAATVSPAPRPDVGADEGEFEEQVVLSGSVDVPRGTAVGEVVVFHGRVTVEGVVHGDVVVLSGPATVSGQVSGSVVTVDGSVTLRSSAQVGRDVLSGGGVSMQPGAYVGGRIRRNVSFTLSPAVTTLGVLLVSFMMAASLLIVGLVLMLLAPRGLERIGEASRGAPFVSLGLGVAIALGLPLVAVALLVTVVGLPLGLAFLAALALVFLVGFASAAWSVGRALVPAPRSRWGAFGAGWGIATLLGLVPVLNVIVWIAGSVFGTGALAVAVWRARHEPRVVVLPAAPEAAEPLAPPASPSPADEPSLPATPPSL